MLDDAYRETYGLYGNINSDHPLAPIMAKPRESVLGNHPIFNLQKRYAKYAPTFKELSISFDDLLYNPKWLVNEWFIIAMDIAEKRGAIADNIRRGLEGKST